MKLFSFDNGIVTLFGIYSVTLYLCIGNSSRTTNLEDNSNLASQQGNATNFERLSLGKKQENSSTTLVVNDLSGQALTDSLTFGNNVLSLSNESTSAAINSANDSRNEALIFGETAINSVNESGVNSLSFADSVVNTGFAFGDESLVNSFEFGAGSLDAAFEFSRQAAEQSSIENQKVLSSAIAASTGAQNSVLQLAKDVATPQSEIARNSIIAVVVLAVVGFAVSRKK